MFYVADRAGLPEAPKLDNVYVSVGCPTSAVDNRPVAHVSYEERVDWIDGSGALPKFRATDEQIGSRLAIVREPTLSHANLTSRRSAGSGLACLAGGGVYPFASRAAIAPAEHNRTGETEMKKPLQAVVLACALASASLMGGLAAHAQAVERVYDEGSVWRVSSVEVKPGMFNTYMMYLSTSWRAIQEAGKQRGDVLSYKILRVDATRDHEPDLYLLVEYKNMAVFDESMKDSDAQTAAVFGSVAKAQEMAVTRETMRTGRGQMLLRELKFIN